jgi:hypothetical protein
MADFNKTEISENAYKFAAIIVLVVITVEVLTDDISRLEIQSILNTYIIVQIAIVSVAFVAMSMKSDEKLKGIYKELLGLALFSIILMALDLMLFFSSFIGKSDSINTILLKILFGGVTWMTFYTLFMTVKTFMHFDPELSELIDKE